MSLRDQAAAIGAQPPRRSFRAQIQALERLAADLRCQVDPRGLPRATDADQLEFQMRMLREQHEVLARAQTDLARTREELAQHQEGLARRQEALAEAQRRLVEQIEARRSGPVAPTAGPAMRVPGIVTSWRHLAIRTWT